MTNIGKLIRINRLFSHPSGNFCSIAIDHFIGYSDHLPEGLRDIRGSLERIVEAKPDAITMHKGVLKNAWTPYAGKIPVILQSIIARPDDSAFEALAFPEDAIRLGADGYAVAIFVKGRSEANHIRLVADMVRQASQFEIPLICHVYPRDEKDLSRISYQPEDIAWAVRCAVEAGADIIKVPYCGEVSAYHQIVSESPVPIVAAGGPKADRLETALVMISEVMQSGAKGATIGRNVWGVDNVTGAVLAFKALIHDHATVDQALQHSLGKKNGS